MQDTDAFYTPEPTRYTFTPALPSVRATGEEGLLTFPSGFTTPHPENNVVRARFFPANPIRKPRNGAAGPRRAVVVLAQWNSDADGHVGLCKLLSKLGIASLRISLPYHDVRMPPELTRADYIVSSNIVRTVQVCRQAVRDVRLALWWLRDQGYDRLGLLGTSLGSCLSLLTACHEPLVKAQALNHVSPFFGDVVWRGLSTEHVRQGLDGHVTSEDLRDLWAPISPWSFLDRLNEHADADGLRDVRPDVSGGSVAAADRRNAAARQSARGQRAAVRPLLNGRRALQVSRRVVSGEVSGDEVVGSD